MAYAYLIVLGLIHLFACVLPPFLNEKHHKLIHRAAEILVIMTYFAFGFYVVMIVDHGLSVPVSEFYFPPPRNDVWV